MHDSTGLIYQVLPDGLISIHKNRTLERRTVIAEYLKEEGRCEPKAPVYKILTSSKNSAPKNSTVSAVKSVFHNPFEPSKENTVRVKAEGKPAAYKISDNQLMVLYRPKNKT